MPLFLKSPELLFLGQIVSKNEIVVYPIKVKAFIKMKVSTNVKEIKWFLGATGYFRHFFLNMPRKQMHHQDVYLYICFISLPIKSRMLGAILGVPVCES